MDKLLTYWTDSDTLPGAHKEWHLAALGKLLCAECGDVLRSHYPNPVDVRLRERLPEFPKNMSCGGICSWGRKYLKLDVFATSFLDAIREHLGSFVIGRCFDSEGVLIPTHATCYTRDTILIRGDVDTDYWACGTCGKKYSFTRPPAPRYVLRSDLGEAMVYQSTSGRFFIADTVARKMDWTQWPDLDLEWVEIRSSGPTPQFVTVQRSEVDAERLKLLELRDEIMRDISEREKGK